jgi:cellulose synthase/poly-beta-1,6-N-acetylglucosamine synthase-like glycosyltransferase
MDMVSTYSAQHPIPPDLTDVDSEFAVSVVVIGRNESARLPRCLASIHRAAWNGLRWELIYVDSRSSDNSVTVAQNICARVLDLGSANTCAAAARNVGWRVAHGAFILFLDGDTELEPEFVRQALPVLGNPKTVAVWGHRRESNPTQSIYTRVLDLDWIFAPGKVDYFGGDALVRRQALLEVGGFDDTLVAGEEPELSQRLRARGWQIEHIDVPMTRHDLGIRSLRAWWVRAERAGLAYAQVAARFRDTSDPLWSQESRRNLWHGATLLALSLLIILTLTTATFSVLLSISIPWVGETGLVTTPWAAPVVLILTGALLAAWARSAARCRWKCPENMALAWCYAAHSHLQQIPILIGQWRWFRLARQQKAPHLIEYRMHG